LGGIWEYRALLWNLLRRNLVVKYQRSTIGFVWTLLQPLTVILVLVLVFTRIARIPINDYWAFLISGYFVWNFLQLSLAGATYTLGSHASIIRNVPFPKEVLVLGTVLAHLVEFALEMALIVIVLILGHHQKVPASLTVLPLLTILLLVLALGLVFPLATLSVFYHDIQHALPLVLIALFYISPVFYPLAMVPPEFRVVYQANPMARVLALFHTVLYEGRFPNPSDLLMAFAMASGLLAVGYLIFNHYRSLLAEMV
jgi:ABC-type polysaccharide/polyol phosphate export permease